MKVMSPEQERATTVHAKALLPPLAFNAVGGISLLPIHEFRECYLKEPLIHRNPVANRTSG